MPALVAQGWSAPFPGIAGAQLKQASVLIGPAEKHAELRGVQLPGGTGERFHFYGITDQLEKWAFCGYDTPAGYARLVYQIPVSGRGCETRVKRSRGRLIAASLRCD